ncbi:MAG: 3-ketoacyl-ACP reductase [Alicyclobacillaceae bacterium]|uniref:3-ketoacyl-ACP reductase n=1 Tax=Alicyclobacillus sp. SP_1 TaxID=2942475 RepID=UPI002158883F|nr:3-ketoacyl-ACP reductase [Alicyclobacillus sp. SP_1]MCY0886989.1 3-ketoacyl-ACP reductase [Alicyclobacillaceae bacterium]
MALREQTALVTGAGRGIGKAIATLLASEGVHVGMLARTSSGIDPLAKQLAEEFGVRTVAIATDISAREEVEQAVAAVQEHLGSLDILVNNAGIGTFGSLVDMPVEEWERIVRVNLFGTYYVTRSVLPSMIKAGHGSIVNISSTSGERGAATTSAYSASKFGIMGMTESLMQEVRKHNIRVTALTPSTVNTELAAKAGLKTSDEDWMMQPDDVAELVLACLKLPDRVFVKTAGLWMTNPR